MYNTLPSARSQPVLPKMHELKNQLNLLKNTFPQVLFLEIFIEWVWSEPLGSIFNKHIQLIMSHGYCHDENMVEIDLSLSGNI